VNVPDVAEASLGDQRPRLLALGVEAGVEVRGVDEPAAPGELEQLRRLRRVQRERLLADDVLPRLERRPHLRIVQVVRRRHVDDVDALVCEHRLEGLVRVRQRDAAAQRPRPLRRGADDAEDLDAEPAERVDVDDADEARPDDCRAQLRHLRARSVHSGLWQTASRLFPSGSRGRSWPSIIRTANCCR
jgi:hypothetical protein